MSLIGTFTEQRVAIEDRTLYTIDSEITPIQFDNIGKLVKGTSTIKDSTQTDEWIRMTILDEDSIHPTVGGQRTRFQGQIVFNIFVREGTGSNRARELADELFYGFDGIAFQGIHCASVSINPVPPTDGWYQLNVSTDFYWDRCK